MAVKFNAGTASFITLTVYVNYPNQILNHYSTSCTVLTVF